MDYEQIKKHIEDAARFVKEHDVVVITGRQGCKDLLFEVVGEIKKAPRFPEAFK